MAKFGEGSLRPQVEQPPSDAARPIDGTLEESDFNDERESGIVKRSLKDRAPEKPSRRKRGPSAARAADLRRAPFLNPKDVQYAEAPPAKRAQALREAQPVEWEEIESPRQTAAREELARLALLDSLEELPAEDVEEIKKPSAYEARLKRAIDIAKARQAERQPVMEAGPPPSPSQVREIWRRAGSESRAQRELEALRSADIGRAALEAGERQERLNRPPSPSQRIAAEAQGIRETQDAVLDLIPPEDRIGAEARARERAQKEAEILAERERVRSEARAFGQELVSEVERLREGALLRGPDGNVIGLKNLPYVTGGDMIRAMGPAFQKLNADYADMMKLARGSDRERLTASYTRDAQRWIQMREAAEAKMEELSAEAERKHEAPPTLDDISVRNFFFQEGLPVEPMTMERDIESTSLNPMEVLRNRLESNSERREAIAQSVSDIQAQKSLLDWYILYHQLDLDKIQAVEEKAMRMRDQLEREIDQIDAEISELEKQLDESNLDFRGRELKRDSENAELDVNSIQNQLKIVRKDPELRKELKEQLEVREIRLGNLQRKQSDWRSSPERVAYLEERRGTIEAQIQALEDRANGAELRLSEIDEAIRSSRAEYAGKVQEIDKEAVDLNLENWLLVYGNLESALLDQLRALDREEEVLTKAVIARRKAQFGDEDLDISVDTSAFEAPTAEEIDIDTSDFDRDEEEEFIQRPQAYADVKVDESKFSTPSKTKQSSTGNG